MINTKRIFTALLLVIMAVTSYAYDFEVDGIYYCYDVYGNAVVTHGNKKYTGKIKIPSEVKWNGKKKKVVEIGDYAFECCYELKSVSIPSSVYYIGRFAFDNCYLLEEINIPNGVEAIKVSAFSCCDKLENISLPVSVKQIEVHAFVGSGLKTIKLFGDVTSIEEYAFADCFHLTDFYCYSDNSPQTAENVFANVDLKKVNLHVPCNRKDAYTGADYWRDFGHIFTTDEVKQDGLWYRLDDKTWEAAIINNPDGNSRIIYEGDIVIPTDIGFSHANYDVTSIGVRAFEYSNITSVSIPKSVVSIGTSAFVGCI